MTAFQGLNFFETHRNMCSGIPRCGFYGGCLMARNGKLAEDLVQALERDIVTGMLQPGDRLDERGLSERFNVSRTPVREALQSLARSGLVATLPRRGTVVASITVGELIEMFEVMAELEAMCARLAARRMARVDIDRLNELSAECDARWMSMPITRPMCVFTRRSMPGAAIRTWNARPKLCATGYRLIGACNCIARGGLKNPTTNMPKFSTQLLVARPTWPPI
jgi:DNA-binding transcriptional regulator YhcF (GntR family)